MHTKPQRVGAAPFGHSDLSHLSGIRASSFVLLLLPPDFSRVKPKPMNLLKHIAQTWKTIRGGGGSLTQSWLRGEDIADGAGANLASAYQQSTWVYAAVTALATNVSQIPF